MAESLVLLEKKARTVNFVSSEKALLLDLVDMFQGTIENKRTDATTSKVRLFFILFI